MISYDEGICGEDDFRYQRLKKARIPAGMAGIFQTKNYGYGLDMEGFWSGDNYRIIAVIPTSPFTLGIPLS